MAKIIAENKREARRINEIFNLIKRFKIKEDEIECDYIFDNGKKVRVLMYKGEIIFCCGAYRGIQNKRLRKMGIRGLVYIDYLNDKEKNYFYEELGLMYSKIEAILQGKFKNGIFYN